MAVLHGTEDSISEKFQVRLLWRCDLNIADKPPGRKVGVRRQCTPNLFRKESATVGCINDNRGCVGVPVSQRRQAGQSTIEGLGYPFTVAMVREVRLHSRLPMDELPNSVVTAFRKDESGPEKVGKVVLEPVCDG
ncbi:UNVERIFIED_CONTAM: hypothetical protein OHV15_05990 [Microbacterium sp. SLM126]